MFVLGLLLAFAALHLPQQTDFEAFDPCEVSCPCDAPASDQSANALATSAQDLIADLSSDGLERPDIDYPCPTDCPDCHCSSSHVMAKPTDLLPYVAHHSGEIMDAEKLFSLTNGTYPGIFHPPRTISS